MELFFIQNSIYNINRNNIYISDTNKKTLTDLFYLLNPFLINYKYIKNYILSGGDPVNEGLSVFKYWLTVLVKVLIAVFIFLHLGCLPCALVLTYFLYSKKLKPFYEKYIRSN